jgi:hypothetical protein
MQLVSQQLALVSVLEAQLHGSQALASFLTAEQHMAGVSAAAGLALEAQQVGIGRSLELAAIAANGIPKPKRQAMRMCRKEKDFFISCNQRIG